MEFLLAFGLGIVTTVVTEVAKKYDVPPRFVLAIIAGLIAGAYMLVSLLVGQAALDAVLYKGAGIMTVWYSTATIAYEWVYKLLFQKQEGK